MRGLNMKNSYQIENLNNPKTAIEIEDLLNMDDHISYVTINFNKKRIYSCWNDFLCSIYKKKTR